MNTKTRTLGSVVTALCPERKWTWLKLPDAVVITRLAGASRPTEFDIERFKTQNFMRIIHLETETETIYEVNIHLHRSGRYRIYYRSIPAANYRFRHILRERHLAAISSNFDE